MIRRALNWLVVSERRQYLLIGVAFVGLFAILLPRYPWSFDGADYAYSIRQRAYAGQTGHPVYAYLGWLVDAMLGPLGASAVTSVNTLTFLSSGFFLVAAVLYTRRLSAYIGRPLPPAVTVFFLLTSPFVLYYLAQIEVYLLATALGLLSLFFLLTPAEASPSSYANTACAAVLFALGVGTHLNLAFLVPVILFLLAESGRWKKPGHLAAGALALVAGLAVVYAPPYLAFRDLGTLWRWATADGAAGHFFRTDAMTIVKKTILVAGACATAIITLLLAAYTLRTHPKRGFALAVLVSMIVMAVVYASSPVNGQIEQLLLASVMLSSLAAVWFPALDPHRRRLVIAIALLSFLSVIPIKVAFTIKDAIVSNLLRLAREHVPPHDASVLNLYTTAYFKLFLPETSVVGLDAISSGRRVYVVDTVDVLAMVEKEGASSKILATWKRPEAFFERPLSRFINLPYSWRGTYVVAKVE